jgi:single-stranded DNA-binding protein
MISHLDAFVSSKVEIKYLEANGDKKSRLTWAVTTNRPVFEILGASEGDSQKYADKQEGHMLYCTAFGQTADKLKDRVQAKARLVLMGRLNRSVYTDRNGAEHESVNLTVFHLVPMDSFDNAPKYMSAVKALNRKGEAFTMISGVAGKITYVGEVQSGTRDSYLHFSVEATAAIDAAYAQANGTYDKTKKYDNKKVSVTVWGKRAESLAKILKTGMPVVISGSVTTNENNGQTYYNMSAQSLSLYPKVADPNAAAAAAANTAAAPAAPGYDEPQFDNDAPQEVPDFGDVPLDAEDDELPF